MPFGYYEAEYKTKKKKVEKPQVQMNRPAPVRPAPPPPPKAPVNTPIPPIPNFQVAGNIMNVSILIAGRSVGEGVDLVTGVYENANNLLNEHGLSLYADDNAISFELLQKQQQLRSLISGGSQDSYDPDAGLQQGIRVYTLKISPSGVQDAGIQLNLVCSTCAAAMSALPQCHSVWVLADAQMYDEQDGGYASAASQVLSAAKSAGMPASIVMCQFEKYGKIRNKDNMCSAEQDVYYNLSGKIKGALSCSLYGVPIIPVQIYGGLAYGGPSDNGGAVFSANRYGGLVDYKPEGCYIPLLDTIDRVNSARYMIDNQIIHTIKQLNRQQKTEFFRYGIEIEG